MPDPPLYACSWDLEADAWTSLLSRVPDEALVLAEAADEVLFGRRGDLSLGATWRGHAFTAGWHAQWRRLGTSVRLVVLGAAPLADALPEPDEGRTLDLANAEVQEDRHLLWGQRMPGEAFWLESRVPHVMQPPTLHPSAEPGGGLGSERPQRRALTLLRYIDPDDGRLLLLRYTGLVLLPVSESGELLDAVPSP